MIDIEKFICSLLADHPVGVTVREDIHKALKDQGLEYKSGKIVPIEDKTELKENEDGQSKKWILEYLYDGLRRSDEQFKDQFKAAIAWLEKQGEPKPISITDEWIEEYWKHEKVNNPHSYDKGDEIQFDHQGFVNFCKKYCQKPTNEVEPKFNVGDWVVRGDTIAQILDIQEQYYVGLDINGKDFTSSRFLNDDKIHFWTIQDAKDGDVLAFDNDTIVIFKDLYNATTFHSYCHIEDGVFDFNEDGMPDWWEGEGFKPATKEQRDALMKAMANAGWEFDFEKKELKRIEQNPTNEEMKEILQTEYEKGRADAIAEMQKPAEYEMPLLEKFKQAVYDCAWGKVTCKKEGETKEEYANRWAEHFLLMIRDWADDYIENREITITRRAYDKGKTDTLKKQNSAWSKEDKVMLDEIIDFFENGTVKLQHDLSLYASWLKSLRPQKQWRPSEEQLEALDSATENCAYSEYQDCLRELIRQLKKLKG